MYNGKNLTFFAKKINPLHILAVFVEPEINNPAPSHIKRSERDHDEEKVKNELGGVALSHLRTHVAFCNTLEQSSNAMAP
jgi:hypothetical protein